VYILTAMFFSLVLQIDQQRQYTFVPRALINDTCSCISAAPYLTCFCKLSVLSYFCNFRPSGPFSVLQRGWWTLWKEKPVGGADGGGSGSGGHVTLGCLLSHLPHSSPILSAVATLYYTMRFCVTNLEAQRHSIKCAT